MSSIDKMLIQGIRSFSPDNKAVIEFYKPLTLIVGHNGAGKTTVIECLKMATTGDLPPNTRSGQNFIHDPKVAGETEVKAQIKLRFYNASNRSFIVVRSFQLTQKKNGLTFKALDQTLTHVDDGGNQVALTNRCADMNAMVPAVMGVSKAILENVIFVHQEDSNWPLAEGTVLKKRFDDIFAATKYTKALEELRKTKTRQVQDAKEMRLKLETLKTHKDQAARLRSTVRANTDRAATLRANIDSLEGRMADIQAALAAVNEKLLSMADYGDDIVSLKARYDTLDAKNAETYARLAASFPEDDLEHSVAALEELERDLGPQVAQLDGNIKTLERDANSARMKADALRDQGEKELATHSRLKAEADAHVRSVADRDQFLKEINGESYFGTDPFTQEEVSELKARFQGRLEAGREALKQAQSRRQLEEDAVGQELDAVAARISGAAEGVKMKQEAVRSNDARLTEIQAQLDRLDATAGGGDAALDAAKARKRDVEGRLAAKEAELAACSSADDGQRLSETLAAVASQIDILRAERAGLAAAADEASKMNYKAQELAVAEKKLETLLSRQRGNLTMVLGTTELPAPGPMLVEAVETVIAIRQVEEDTAKTALKAVQDELAGVKGSLAATESQLKRADAEATSLAGQLASGMAGSGGQSVGTRVQKLEEERTDKSNRVQQNNAFVLIVDHLCQVAEKENKCMSCDRKFATPAERGTFVAKKKEELKRLPEKVDDLKKQVKELEAKLDQLRLLEPAAARHDALRDKEIPDLQRTVAKLQQDAEALTLRAESAAAAEKSAIEALRDAHQALQEGAMPLLRLSQDITTRNHELDALRVTLKTSDAGSSVADIDMRLAELESQRTQLQRERERAASTLSLLRDEVSTLRTQLHRTQEDILRLSAASEKRASLEAQQAELLAAKDSMAKAVVEGKRAVAPLEHRRLELTRKRDEIRRRARDEEGELEATLRALQMQETQLEARERALEGYVSRGVAAALTTAETNLKKLRAKQEEEEKKCRDLLAEIANLKATERDTATLARQVAELLAYRRSKAEEEALGLELDEKGASLAAIGDRAALQQECRSLEAKERDLRSEADRARGALATVQVTAEDAARQLDAKEYKDIDGKYRRQLIELRTTEMASNDLDIYHKALERALLTFHTSKMADINKIVKELWQKTYRNSDIDYIQLKADVEGGTAARSYNYRMVMVVGGTELDMRGRCSAGQRVLACLVIRLALAETFCLNCGILALDEPTTNLDSENAASLAEALKALMLARRDQENFQLVVITHDEAFARLLGTREHAECMWRVVKDENQHSTVIKEDIAE